MAHGCAEAARPRPHAPLALRLSRLVNPRRRVPARTRDPVLTAHARTRARLTNVVDEHDQQTHRTIAQEPISGRSPLYIGLAVWGWWARVCHADRCHSRSLRQPGHRLHRLDRAQPAGSRRSGHLPADRQPPGSGRRSRRAIAVGVRVLDDLCRSSRTTSISYFARTRVLERLSLVAKSLPAGRHADARSRCDGRRPRLLVHGREPHAFAARTAQPAGLVHPLSAQRCSRRGRGRLGRRSRPAVSDRRRSESAPHVQPAPQRRRRCRPRQQRQRGRQRARGERRLADRARRRADCVGRRRQEDRRRCVRTACRSTSSRSPTFRLATPFAWRRSSKEAHEAVGGVVVARTGVNTKRGDRCRQGPYRADSSRSSRGCDDRALSTTAPI